MKKILTAYLLLLAFFSFGQEIDSTIVTNVDGTMETSSVSTMEKKMTDSFHAGKYKKAVEYSAVLLDWAKEELGEEHPDYASWLRDYGTTLHHSGDKEGALYYLEKAVNHLIKYVGKENEDYITSMVNIGMLYKSLDRHDKAINSLEEALEIRNKIAGEELMYLNVILNNLGLIYLEVNKLDRSLELYNQSKVVTEKHFGIESVHYGNLLHNIANFHMQKGDYQTAISTYKEAIKIYESKLGRKHHFYYNALNFLSLSLMKNGEIEEALRMSKETLTLAEENLPPNHPYQINIRLNLARITINSGELNEAKEILLKVEELALGKVKTKFSSKITAYYLLAEVYDKLDNQEEVLNYCDKLVATHRERLRTNIGQLSQSTQASFLKKNQAHNNAVFSFVHNNLGKDNQEIATELGFELNLIQKGLLLNNQRVLRKSVHESQDSIISQKFEEWKELNATLGEELLASATDNSTAAASTEILRKIDKLERELVKKPNIFQDLIFDLSWRDLQNQLNEDEVIIDFSHFHYQNGLELTDSTFYVAYIIRKDSSSPMMLSLFEEEELVSQKSLKKLYSPDNTTETTSLEKVVWQKIQAHLEGVNTIFYSPSGYLHRVNFGAIPISETETVSNRFQLRNLGSTRQLEFPHPIADYSITDAVIYGGIDYQKNVNSDSLREELENSEDLASRNLGKSYRSLRENGWTYLEWTKKEVDYIAQSLNSKQVKVKLLKDKEATEESFKKIGTDTPSPRILHLATHGYFFPDPKTTNGETGFQKSEHPLIRSGLILAGANHVWKGGTPQTGKEDGILTAYEIAQMDLSNTELVVLSACETGLGDIEGNEGVYGLQRAFKMAGAKYVLMSLWSVNDQSTYEFMTRFYELYQQEGKSIPEAYQMTQNEMRLKYLKPFMPYAWAGFVLVE